MLVVYPDEQGPLGGPWPRVEDNIKMGYRENEVWIHLSQDSVQWWVLVNTVINL
jgi:hypothetical protein